MLLACGPLIAARAQTDAGQSTLVAADGTAIADAVDTELITVTLLAADGTTPVVGHSVMLAVAAGGSAGLTISAPSGLSTAAGVVTFTVSSTVSKVVTLQAIDLTDAIVVNQTADVDFTPNVTDADNATVVAANGTAVADGVETDLITVTLLNALGNPVPGHNVSLAVSAGGAAGVSISAPSGVSSAAGVVTFTVSSTISKTVTFQATDDTDGVPITQTADVDFTPDLTDADTSTVVTADGTAVADDLDTELITVTVLNVASAPLSGRNVSLAVVAGGAAGVSISAPSGPSDATGVVTFTVSSSVSKVVTFQATDDTDGVTITQTVDVDFTPNVTDPDTATVVTADGTAVADGVQTELVTVTLLNMAGNPMAGHDVSLAVVAGGAAGVSISAPSGASSAAGVVTFTVSSTISKTVTFQATDDTDGVTISQTVNVNFTPNITHAGNSTVGSADGSAVADGVETELITVTLLNAAGNPVFGHDVSLAVSAGGAAGVSISAPSGVSDATGVVTFTVSSTISKVVTFRATDDSDGVTITQTANVDFTANISDAGNSTVVNDDGTAVADGVETELITVTLLNTAGNPVFGHDVSLAVSAGGAAGVTISAPSGVSDATGVVTFTVNSTVSKVVTFQATDDTDGVAITQTVAVDFTPNITDVDTSTVLAADGTAVADGLNTELITVTLLNASGNPVFGHDVSLAIVAGGAAGVSISAPSGVSDAAGVVTFTVSSTVAKTVTLRATDETDGVTITQTADVEFTPNFTDADTSTVVAADGSAVADGLDTELITVTVRNAADAPLPGRTVSLAIVASGAAGVSISAPSGLSGADGVVTFTVSSTISKTVTFQATDETDGTVITQTADVDFTPNVTDPDTATVVAADGSAVADDVDTELVTVTLLNAAGNPLVGHTVSLAVSAGGAAGVTISAPSGVSSVGGVVTFTVRSSIAKVVTFQATDVTDGAVITQTAAVTFAPNATDADTATVTAADGTAVADGVETELVTVTLLNALGHPVPGHDVSLAVSAGGADNVTISAPSGASDANGVVTFAVGSSEPKVVTFRATDDTDGVVITQTAAVTFAANVTSAAASTVVAADGSAIADGVATELITVTLLNAGGNPVWGHDVSLAIIAGGDAGVTISAPSGPSDADGVVTFTVSSNQPKVIVLRAQDDTDGVTITQTAVVTFTPGAPHHLNFVVQPSNTDRATPLLVSIEIVDALEHRVDVTSPVTLTLLDPDGCGGTLTGTTTKAAVAGLAQFSEAENVKVTATCHAYYLRASSAGVASVDSNLFHVGLGSNILCAAAAVTVHDTHTDLTATYAIEGDEVPAFTVAYGLKYGPGAAAAIDTVLGTHVVSALGLRSPGLHTISLGDVRPVLNQVIRHGDQLVVHIDCDHVVQEASDDDNIAATSLHVDLVLTDLLTDIRGGGSNARIFYTVVSPADVPDFTIRVGLDWDRDGVMDEALPDILATGTLTQPGAHVVTVNLAETLLAQGLDHDAPFGIIALLDPNNEVAEADNVGNNRRSTTDHGYVALTLALVNTLEPVLVGAELALLWRVANTGNVPATDAVLTLATPSELAFLQAESADDEQVLEALEYGAGVAIALGTLPPGESLDVEVYLEALARGQFNIWAAVATDSYTVHAADARIIVRGEGDEDGDPSGVVVEDITTTVHFIGLCGATGVPLLTLNLLAMLVMKASLRARRQ